MGTGTNPYESFYRIPGQTISFYAKKIEANYTTCLLCFSRFKYWLVFVHAEYRNVSSLSQIYTQSTYIGRDEIGWNSPLSWSVYSTATLYVMVNKCCERRWACTPCPHHRQGKFFHHDGMYARKRPLPLCVFFGCTDACSTHTPAIHPPPPHPFSVGYIYYTQRAWSWN